MNGLTPLPPATPDAVNGHLLHSTSSTRSDTSSNSPLDTNPASQLTNVGATSPVTSAVRSLNNLSDFSLDVSNGNYDNYGGITDSLLSAEANKEPKEASGGTASAGPPVGHHRAHQSSGGPLLDFKSAFSDLDSKPSDLRYIFLQPFSKN